MPLEFVGQSLDDLVDDVERATVWAGRRMASDGLDRLRHNVGINTPVDTGALRGSYRIGDIDYAPVRTSRLIEMAWTGRVYTEVEYAEYVERGTGLWGPAHAPYVIRPKDPGGLLSWVTPDGHRIYAKEVVHPGSPGAAMFRIGAIVTEHEADEWSYEALREWERSVGPGHRGTLRVKSLAEFKDAGFS